MASTHDPDLMEFSDSLSAQAARRSWDDAEWERTFTSLDELLEAGTDRPEAHYPDTLSDEEWAPPQRENSSLWSRLKGWVRRR